MRTALLMLALAAIQPAMAAGFSWQGLKNSALKGLSIVRESETQMRGRLESGGQLIISRRKGSEADAKRLAESRALVIRSAAVPRENPYPGFISREVSSPPAKAPQPISFRQSGAWTIGFPVFLNNRLALSDGRAEEHVYHGVQAVIRCAKQSATFEVKVALPRETTDRELENLLKAFKCGS